LDNTAKQFTDFFKNDRSVSDCIKLFCETNDLRHLDTFHFIVGKRNYFQYFRDLIKDHSNKENNDQLRSASERKRSENVDDMDFLIVNEIYNMENGTGIDTILKKYNIPEKQPMEKHFFPFIIESLSKNLIMKKRLSHQL